MGQPFCAHCDQNVSFYRNEAKELVTDHVCNPEDVERVNARKLAPLREPPHDSWLGEFMRIVQALTYEDPHIILRVTMKAVELRDGVPLSSPTAKFLDSRCFACSGPTDADDCLSEGCPEFVPPNHRKSAVEETDIEKLLGEIRSRLSAYDMGNPDPLQDNAADDVRLLLSHIVALEKEQVLHVELIHQQAEKAIEKAEAERDHLLSASAELKREIEKLPVLVITPGGTETISREKVLQAIHYFQPKADMPTAKSGHNSTEDV